MLKSAFGTFHQFAWVTNDMDRSLANFKNVYGIPSFLVMDQSFDAVVGGQKGKMQLRIALTKVDDVEFEVIQPVGGGIDAIYRDALPADGSYATVFHHFSVMVDGTQEDWERHLAGLHPDRPIYFHHDGDSPGVRFVYTDDRAFLGHYVEHIWYAPEIRQGMAKAIPHFHTKSTDKPEA